MRPREHIVNRQDAKIARNLSCLIRPWRSRYPAPALGGLGRSFLVLLALVSFLFPGCGARETEDEFLVKNAVRKYNTALVESYRTGDPTLLDGLATEREMRRVDILIGTLQGQNRRLRATLDRIDFGAVQGGGDRLAKVSTHEAWSYEHMDLTRQTRVGNARRIEYDLLYTLERQGARWMVAHLAISEQPAGK